MRLETISLLVVIFNGSAQALARSQEENESDRLRFEVSADTVLLDVAVTTREGRHVPGLVRADFRVYEDGAAQTVTHFTSEVTPVSIVLLLDVSSSIHPSLDGVKAGANRFIAGLREADTMRLGFFNHKLRFSNEFTDDPVALARDIRTMRSGGMTALYDAILGSLDTLTSLDTPGAIPGRKALVIFADGDDSRPAAEGSVASRTDALEAGKTSEVSIYTVGFRGRRPAGRGVNRGFLRQIARESGGLAFFPQGFSELDKAFALIQNEVHSQYRLAYTPTARTRGGAWREIVVRIDKAEHLVVRSRTGYYARPAQDSLSEPR